MFKLLHAIAIAISLAASGAAQAQTYAFAGSDGIGTITLYWSDGHSEVVATTDQGWWSTTEQNFAGNANTIVGSSFGVSWNDFFVFDLSGKSGTVAAASVNLNASIVGGLPAIALWDVSTPLPALENLNAPPNPTIYADLGSGTRYSPSYPIAVSNQAVAIPLNAAGIAAVNAALGGTIAIGGSLDQPIPEPSSATILALIAGTLAALRYRARQTAKRSALSNASRSTAPRSRT